MDTRRKSALNSLAMMVIYGPAGVAGRSGETGGKAQGGGEMSVSSNIGIRNPECEDHFEHDNQSEFDFPCCCCRYAQSDASDYPCCHCRHNVNAIPEEKVK
jgi:hypothetical protein